VADSLKGFARRRVEYGQFVREYPQQFERHQRVDRKLLGNLRALRAELAGYGATTALDALIGSSIFVRYLEERGILTTDHLLDLGGSASYVAILRAGVQATAQLFRQLTDRFNGDVFTSAADELVELDHEALAAIAAFLEGEDVVTHQRTFWPYDFSIIPPELISSIYEQLLEGTRHEDAAYYTPRQIVDLMLDEVLPWHEATPRAILDPACGSGIFLTESFRRISFTAHRFTTPQPETLATLLKQCIFGCDKNITAIRVAAFSLYLALLEELDVGDAWDHARLPKLVGENLIVADFFEAELKDKQFDLIVGNPPWRSALTPAGERYVDERRLPVPDKQAAMAFLWRARDLLSSSGTLALLMPAKPLLHNKSRRAIATRATMFDRLLVRTIIDLSAFRRDLFVGAVAPSAVLVATRRSVEVDSVPAAIVHVAPHHAPLQQSIDGFVLSEDDVHSLPQRVLEAYPDALTIYLSGSEDDFTLITSVRSRHPTVREIGRERGWICSRGYQELGGEKHSTESVRGLPRVPATAIYPFWIDDDQVEAMELEHVHRIRNARLYQWPRVLIRRGIVNQGIAAALTETPAVFNDSVIGVAAPPGDVDQLKVLAGCLNSTFAAYYQILTSSSWGIERDYIEQNEHLSLPLPQLDGERRRIFSSLIDDIQGRASAEKEWQDDLDRAVFTAYGLNSFEVDLVLDSLHCALERLYRREDAVIFDAPTVEQLGAYCKALETALANTLPSVQVEVGVLRAPEPYPSAVVRFRVDDSNGSVDEGLADAVATAIDEMRGASNRWDSEATILQSTALVLYGDTVTIVKPAEAQFWTKSRARADAAKILGQMLDGGET